MWMPACYRTHKVAQQEQILTAPAAVITISGQSIVWSMLSWTAMCIPVFWESMHVISYAKEDK